MLAVILYAYLRAKLPYEAVSPSVSQLLSKTQQCSFTQCLFYIIQNVFIKAYRVKYYTGVRFVV